MGFRLTYNDRLTNVRIRTNFILKSAENQTLTNTIMKSVINTNQTPIL